MACIPPTLQGWVYIDPIHGPLTHGLNILQQCQLLTSPKHSFGTIVYALSILQSAQLTKLSFCLTLEILLILNCNDMFPLPLVTDPKEDSCLGKS